MYAKMRCAILLFTIAILAVSFGVVQEHGTTIPSPAVAAPLTEKCFYAGADASVWNRFPNENYGNTSNLNVEKGPSDVQRAFLRFNLDAVPAYAEISAAVVHINLLEVAQTEFTTAIQPVQTDWGESTITWNNQPQIGNIVAEHTHDGSAGSHNLGCYQSGPGLAVGAKSELWPSVLSRLI